MVTMLANVMTDSHTRETLPDLVVYQWDSRAYTGLVIDVSSRDLSGRREKKEKKTIDVSPILIEITPLSCMKRTILLHRGPDVGKLGRNAGRQEKECRSVKRSLFGPCRTGQVPLSFYQARMCVQVRKHVSLRYLTLVKESKKAFREDNSIMTQDALQGPDTLTQNDIRVKAASL